MSINEVNLKTVCIILNIPALDKEDYVFLNEYMKVTRPIAEALKALEGNRDTFGIYLPTLFGLKFKLDELGIERFMFCKPLQQNICIGFSTRFSSMMDLNNAKSSPLYLAMATNPKFKLNFMPRNISMSVLKKMQNILIKAAEDIAFEKRDDSSNESSTESAPVDANNSGKIIETYSFIF